MKPPMKSTAWTPAMTRARDRMLAILREELADAPADHLVAATAYTLGQMMIHLDQRRFTPELALELVSANLQDGNAHALQAFLDMSAGQA